jgi:hypothetical protein
VSHHVNSNVTTADKQQVPAAQQYAGQSVHCAGQSAVRMALYNTFKVLIQH